MAMPFEEDFDRPRQARVEVRPSAVLELTWALCGLHRHTKLPEVLGPRPEAPALRDELESVWGDDAGCLPDTSILAERLGALLSDEADTFLGGLERAAGMNTVGLDLRSETAEVREMTLARLERLRGDPPFLRRYSRLLARIWELLRPGWEETGREAVLRTCADWSRRLRQGTDFRQLLPQKHIGHDAVQEGLLRQRPRIVLTPLYFVTMGG